MSTESTRYELLQPTKASYALLLIGLLLLSILGGYCAYNMEHTGHVITGMNNRVVWGLPHVFAISLIVAASGALNGASLASVFGVSAYKPYARLSVILALVLLAGGLAVLVLDLGRPDRLFIAMTTYNFRSIFSWNIFLYSGFFVVGIIYLWMMFERQHNKHIRTLGIVAFAWRIVLTTGTGCIFGFLVGRSALDSAVLAPLFIALSFVMGSAVLIIMMTIVAQLQQSALASSLVRTLGTLMIWCLLILAYFSIVRHLTNLYIAQHIADEKNVLIGPYAWLFWLGHVVVGIGLPLLLLARSKLKPAATESSNQTALLWSCGAALVGGAVLLYVIVIGSQTTAQQLFPGKTVTASTFGDTGSIVYHPSWWEWGLGFGGISVALLLFFLILRILPVSPQPSTF